MKRTSKGIARRCTACLMLAAAVVWSIAAIVDGRSIPVSLPGNQYESLDQQLSQLPVGHVAEVFSRMR